MPRSPSVKAVFSPTTAIFIFFEHSFNELLKFLNLSSRNFIPLPLEKIIQWKSFISLIASSRGFKSSGYPT